MTTLFGTANEIRKNAGYDKMTQSEAIRLAKVKLNIGPRTYHAGQHVKTVGGLDAKIICITREQLLVAVTSHCGPHMNFTAKYTIDGYRYTKDSPCWYDLADVA